MKRIDKTEMIVKNIISILGSFVKNDTGIVSADATANQTVTKAGAVNSMIVKIIVETNQNI